MEISKTAILDKTHYGLNIYSHVLRHYYPGEIASGDSLTPSENKNDRQQTVLSLSGRDCQPTKNPFNDNKPTLKIQIVNNCVQNFCITDLENRCTQQRSEVVTCVTLRNILCFHAKQAGVNIAGYTAIQRKQEKVQLPTFPESTYPSASYQVSAKGCQDCFIQ